MRQSALSLVAGKTHFSLGSLLEYLVLMNVVAVTADAGHITAFVNTARPVGAQAAFMAGRTGHVLLGRRIRRLRAEDDVYLATLGASLSLLRTIFHMRLTGAVTGLATRGSAISLDTMPALVHGQNGLVIVFIMTFCTNLVARQAAISLYDRLIGRLRWGQKS